MITPWKFGLLLIGILGVFAVWRLTWSDIQDQSYITIKCWNDTTNECKETCKRRINLVDYCEYTLRHPKDPNITFTIKYHSPEGTTFSEDYKPYFMNESVEERVCIDKQVTCEIIEVCCECLENSITEEEMSCL